MTTNDTDIQPPVAEPVTQTETAAVMPAPVSESEAKGESSGPEAVSAVVDTVAALEPPAGEGEQHTAGAEDDTTLSDDVPLGEAVGEMVVQSDAETDHETEAGAEAEQMPASDELLVPAEATAEPPPPRPIQLVLWNEKVPASAGCWVFWRNAGFECRGKIEKGLFTATCKGYGGSEKSQPIEILLRRRFISQGEALAVMDGMLSFDPHEAEQLGFEIHGRAMLPFLPVSSPLDEEQPAVAG